MGIHVELGGHREKTLVPSVRPQMDVFTQSICMRTMYDAVEVRAGV